MSTDPERRRYRFLVEITADIGDGDYARDRIESALWDLESTIADDPPEQVATDVLIAYCEGVDEIRAVRQVLDRLAVDRERNRVR